MQDVHPYGLKYWYPHMGPLDSAIWERFIAKYPDVFDTVQYDVPVGNVPEHASTPLSDLGGTAEKLYKRKIDVLATKGESFTVIEIKPNAGLQAVGQVVGYRQLYVRDYTPQVIPRAIIITDKIDTDTLEFARSQGVEMFGV